MSKMHPLAMERWVPWNQTFAVSAIIEVVCTAVGGDWETASWKELWGQVPKGPAGAVAETSEGDSGVPCSCLWCCGGAVTGLGRRAGVAP